MQIKNDSDLKKALARLSEVFHAEEDTPEWDECEALCLAIEVYENEHYPTPRVSPEQIILYQMGELGISLKDLAEHAQVDKDYLSEVLYEERKMPLKLAETLWLIINLPLYMLYKLRA